MSIVLILSTGQSKVQVTKGQYTENLYMGHVTHVLWVVLDVEFDGDICFVI